jgi:hypothetical protein
MNVLKEVNRLRKEVSTKLNNRPNSDLIFLNSLLKNNDFIDIDIYNIRGHVSTL